MDQSGTNARIIVLAGQGLCAEELAARCAGPHWDVAAYGDAYAAAAELLKAGRTVLVFAPASIRPWQKPLIQLARRRGISVLACGGDGLTPAEKQYVQVVKPEDLGEFITACLAGHLDEPAAPPRGRAEMRTLAAPAQGEDQVESEGQIEPEDVEETDAESTAAQGVDEPHAPPAPAARKVDDDAVRKSAGPSARDSEGAEPDSADGEDRSEPVEPSMGQLLTPDEIAALLKSDP